MRYYSNILRITRQSQIAGNLPRKAYATNPYTDKENRIKIEQTAGTYSNYNSMKICIPIQFTKKTVKNTAMDPLMVTVNNFFGHWFTDIGIRR